MYTESEAPLPIVHFKGRVLPENSDLGVRGIPSIHFEEPPFLPGLPAGLAIDYSISIDHSAIDLTCDVNPFDPENISWIHNRALHVIHAIVDLYSFASGSPLSVIFDKFVYPDGREKIIQKRNPHLSGICTILETDPSGALKFGRTLPQVVQEPALSLALHDLTSALSDPNTATVNCARAVEGIRLMLWPEKDEKREGWGKLRDTLRVSLDYVLYITKTSEGPRHADRSYLSSSIIDEVIERSWTIMNRFLEYRARNNQPLPPSEFPVL